MGFSPYWYYKLTNAIHDHSQGVNTCEKILKLSTIDETYLKFDVSDGSVVNGVRQPILFSFNITKPVGFKLFCKPETIHYKKKQNCFEYYNILFILFRRR